MDPKVFYGSRRTKLKLNDGNGAQYIINDVIVEPLPGNISDESSSDEDGESPLPYQLRPRQNGALIINQEDDDLEDQDISPSLENQNPPSDVERADNAPSTSVSNDTKWRKQFPPISNQEFKGECFDPDPPEMSPFEYFSQFFDNDLLKHIAHESNLYCSQGKLAGNHNCKDLNIDESEVRQLIGVFLFMGIYPNPNYRMYWSKVTPNSVIQSALDGGVNRFETLKRFLHFNNNQDRPENARTSFIK